MVVLDWEVGALYWNCLKDADGDEQKALSKVKYRFYDDFIKKGLHFLLGTTRQFHSFAPNPWIIIGVLYIPYGHQLNLF